MGFKDMTHKIFKYNNKIMRYNNSEDKEFYNKNQK